MTTTENTNVGDGPGASAPQRHPSLHLCDEFVARVIATCRDAGEQQALRRALGRPEDELPARTRAVLLKPRSVGIDAKDAPARPLIPYDVREKRPFYAVAALIAARPRIQRAAADPAPEEAEADTSPSDRPSSAPATDTARGSGRFRPGGTNLGESLALAVTRRDDAIKEKGAESKLHLMVRQGIGELHRMLPPVVRLVSGTGVCVDYACLLRDLRSWPAHRDDVVTRWLESYYRTLGAERERAKADQ